MGGWKLKPTKKENSNFKPVITFPDVLENFLEPYKINYRNFMKNLYSDTIWDMYPMLEFDFQRVEFFAILAWKQNTQYGFGCSVSYLEEEKMWRYALVILVYSDENYLQCPVQTSTLIAEYKVNIKSFWEKSVF